MRHRQSASLPAGMGGKLLAEIEVLPRGLLRGDTVWRTGGLGVMRMRIAVAAAAVVALVNGALADDQQPPWAGFYVGGQGGQVSNARVSGNLGYSDPVSFPGISAADLFSPVSRQADLSKSALFGIQGGYNWQAGFLVGGVEADMSYVDAKGGFDAVTGTRSARCAAAPASAWARCCSTARRV